jgi:hypothetical protein
MEAFHGKSAGLNKMKAKSWDEDAFFAASADFKQSGTQTGKMAVYLSKGLERACLGMPGGINFMSQVMQRGGVFV